MSHIFYVGANIDPALINASSFETTMESYSTIVEALVAEGKNSLFVVDDAIWVDFQSEIMYGGVPANCISYVSVVAASLYQNIANVQSYDSAIYRNDPDYGVLKSSVKAFLDAVNNNSAYLDAVLQVDGQYAVIDVPQATLTSMGHSNIMSIASSSTTFKDENNINWNKYKLAL